MSKNLSRVPFGKEERLEIITQYCPGCSARHGSYHNYGCPLESCPECGNRLLKCSCIALSIIDELNLTKAISKTLTRQQVLTMAENSKQLDKNYMEKGAFGWILDNMSPELKKEAEEMAIDILGASRQGDMLTVPLGKAAEVMGISEEEAEALYPGWDKRTGDLKQ